MSDNINKYQLSNKAVEDLLSIANYTISNFGKKQARNYKDGIIHTFSILTKNPELGRSFRVNKTHTLLMYRFKSHMIFYKIISSDILIMRILGIKMDFQRHL